MAKRRGGGRRTTIGGLALAACLAAAAPIAAQEQKPATDGQAADKTAESTDPNTGRLSLSAGVDWTSAYFFRGIKQETDDLPRRQPEDGERRRPGPGDRHAGLAFVY